MKKKLFCNKAIVTKKHYSGNRHICGYITFCSNRDLKILIYRNKFLFVALE